MKADIVQMQKIYADFSEYPKKLQMLQEQVEEIAKRVDAIGTLDDLGYKTRKRAEEVDQTVILLQQASSCLEQGISAYIAKEDHIIQFLEESSLSYGSWKSVGWVEFEYDWMPILYG